MSLDGQSIVDRQIETAEKEIKSINKEIGGDIFKLAGASVITIAGVFGVVCFGRELIELYNSDEVLTLKTKFMAEWGESLTVASTIPVVAGGYFVCTKVGSIVGNVREKKVLKKKINELKSLDGYAKR